MKNTLSKSERLTSRIVISQIFSKGNHINMSPLKLVWLCDEKKEKPSVKIVFSVPKKKFKRAVDRNRIKRLLRESYRNNKHGLSEEIINRKLSGSLFLIYIGTEIPDYKSIDDKIILLLKRLTNDITN